MTPDQQQPQQDDDRLGRGAFFGRCSLALMMAFAVLSGALSLFGHLEFMLAVCLLIFPPIAWMAVHCLQTQGGGGKIPAWITLALIASVLINYLIALGPGIVSYYWR